MAYIFNRGLVIFLDVWYWI